MPCVGGPSGPEPDHQKAELDLVTRLLCSILAEAEEELESGGCPLTSDFLHYRVFTKELSDWYENHKKLDRERLKREEDIRLFQLKVKENALKAKLKRANAEAAKIQKQINALKD